MEAEYVLTACQSLGMGCPRLHKFFEQRLVMYLSIVDTKTQLTRYDECLQRLGATGTRRCTAAVT